MIRLAIAGLGVVTGDFHLPAYAQLGQGVTIVGGCYMQPVSAHLQLLDQVFNGYKPLCWAA